MPLLTPRATSNIGTWNVWTMWETGRRSQVAAEMRYNLAVFRTSETHRSQAGLMRLASEEVLSYAGHEENNASYIQAISLMLYEEARNALIGLESHGPMIIKTEDHN